VKRIFFLITLGLVDVIMTSLLSIFLECQVIKYISEIMRNY